MMGTKRICADGCPSLRMSGRKGEARHSFPEAEASHD